MADLEQTLADAEREFLQRADAFAAERGIGRARASTIIFNDGKLLDAMHSRTAGITVDRLKRAAARLGQLERNEVEARRPSAA